MIGGRLYDGTNALAHPVDITVEGDFLVLTQPAGWSERVPATLLGRIDGAVGELRLARSDEPGWRLILDAEAEQQVGPLLGKRERYGRWIDRIGLLPAVAAGAVITAGVVGVGYLAPAWIAPHIPVQWERNLGAGLWGDFGSNRCKSEAGQRALVHMVERVAPGSTSGPSPIKVAALDIPIFNAAALPGGYIVVFRPMITETEPDALAGVLAHEVAHVRRRHVTQALIRELGIGAIVRLFAGNVGANADQIVSLNYTRANESEADADAIEMLRRARISPLPVAKLFTKLSKGESDSTVLASEFLNSHPLSVNRARAFAASQGPGIAYRPALSRDEQDALFDVCAKRKH